MGENADDIVDGLVCHWCGCYFEQEHGHPVLCEKCFKEQERMVKAKEYKARDRMPKALHKELGT